MKFAETAIDVEHQALAFGGQVHRWLVTREKTRAEQTFQTSHGVAHGARGEIQVGGRVPEGTSAGHGLEGAQGGEGKRASHNIGW